MMLGYELIRNSWSQALGKGAISGISGPGIQLMSLERKKYVQYSIAVMAVWDFLTADILTS